MDLRQRKKEDLTTLAVLSACFLVAMLLCSGFTSPLFPHYLGDDSAIFTLLGKGILEGKRLYVDLFDHKGPMIFLVNALGYWLGGRTGIFLLQCVEGIFCLVLLYYTGKRLRPDGWGTSWREFLPLFAIAYIQFFYTFERGNLTEEHSLPAICLSLFLLVKYASTAEEKPEHPPLYGFVYGVSLGYLALMRLNNAATVCGGVLFVAVWLIIKKQYGSLLKNLLAGCLGMAVVVLPILGWFYAQGSLREMIYATFLHNFRYMAANWTSLRESLPQLPKLVVLYLPVVACAVMAIRGKNIQKRSPLDGLLASVFLINVGVLLAANCATHYFVIFFPVFAVFLCRYFRFEKKSFSTFLVVIATVANLLNIGKLCGSSVYRVYIDKTAGARYATVKADFDRIPEQERDSVIGYEIRTQIYLLGDIMPCYKYYALQETWARTAPFIGEEFMDYVENEEPLWVLTEPGQDNEELLRILGEKYTRQFENEYVVYYRLNDTDLPNTLDEGARTIDET